MSLGQALPAPRPGAAGSAADAANVKQEEGAEDVQEAAAPAAEGYTLALAPGTVTGYRGVSLLTSCKSRPYQARAHGRFLGSFPTAVEAAVAR